MGVRRKAREVAFQFLYGIESGRKDVSQTFREFPGQRKEKPVVKDFASGLVKGVCENLERIDKMLAECSINWLPARMTPVDRNIMRIAIYELTCCDTPPAVVIDEAIEIAKKFGTEKSGKFVNGILDCVRKKGDRLLPAASNGESALKE